MAIALYILAALVAVGLILYVLDHRQHPAAEAETAETPAAQSADGADSGCCGMHITCERDSLLAAISDKIEYYDDEELDAYAGRSANDYAADEIETFRDVMLTLKPDEIAGWARSLQLRGITLPHAVRDELIMLVADERAARAAHPVQ
ncbi:MAG: phospholipase [Muribaculaceae bacterium]